MIQQAADLYQQKNYEQSANICHQILSRDTNNVNALHLLGVINYETGDFVHAIDYLKKAHLLSKNNREILIALASCLRNTAQNEQALAYFQQALSLDANNLALLQQCAQLALSISNLTLAKKYITQLLNQTPNDAENWNLNGLLHSQERHYQEAIKSFFNAIELDDRLYSPRLNLASLLQDKGEFQAAKQHYLHVLTHAIDEKIPTQVVAKAHYNLGLMELGEGDLENAWKHILKRPKSAANTITSLNEITDQKLLIIGEEGLGDELMFLRFLPMLQKLCSGVSYLCNPKLKSILQRFSSIQHVLSTDDPLPEHDKRISWMDLPFILNCNSKHNIPEPIALNTQGQAENSKVLSGLPEPYVGISWRAGVLDPYISGEKSLSKAIPLDLFIKIFLDFRGTLVLLQRQPTQSELDYLQCNLNATIFNAQKYNQDLFEMTLLLNQLHAYIGVSNTNIHLFASLKKNACVMIPQPAEWRWLYEGETSPWYSDFTLARQDTSGNWSEAINQCKKYLQSHLNPKVA